LLAAKGERRGRHYVGTEYLKAIAEKIREAEPREIADPFAGGVAMIA
jgi:hypothetical protein